MNISLILPFRERYILLERMLQSVIETASDLSQIEMLIVIDSDEPHKNEFQKIVDYYRQLFAIRTFIEPRSEHFTKDYLNPLAKKAKGRWVIPINDDTDFQTKAWDVIIHEAMDKASQETKDDILLGLTKDEIPRPGENERFPHFSSFPVVPKQVIDVQGFLWDERCIIWGPDHVICTVFRALASTQRLVSLTHVTIGHYSAHTGRRKVHENYERFRLIDAKYNVEIGVLDHTETINKLRGACKT